MLNKKEIDNYFMKKAIAISKKSDDPRTKVGCVFVKNGKVIASGFNAYSPRFKKSKRIYDPIDKKHD
jgi:deoxycytidylate deaminase